MTSYFAHDIKQFLSDEKIQQNLFYLKEKKLVKKIGVSVYTATEIMDVLKKMLDAEPGDIPFSKVFKFKDEEYGFVPNLSKLSTGEYIDLEAYCKDDPMQNLHIIMSVLFRKVVNKRNERNIVINKT